VDSSGVDGGRARVHIGRTTSLTVSYPAAFNAFAASPMVIVGFSIDISIGLLTCNPNESSRDPVGNTKLQKLKKSKIQKFANPEIRRRDER